MSVKDAFWCWVSSGEVKVLAGVVYRKESRGLDMNNKLLRMIERTSELGNGNFVLCGDFNLPKI